MRRVLLRRRADRDDDGVAMMSVVVTLVVSSAAVLALTAAVRGELAPTKHHLASVRAVAAAEAGIQRALAGVRAARALVDGVAVGDATRLPCAPSTAPLTGSVTSDAGYSVVVRYFSDDPTGRDETWRTANALVCVPGAGVDPVPAFALLQSTATGAAVVYRTGAKQRAVEQVYAIASTDSQTRGGLVRTSPDDTSTVLCWDAGSAAPPSGGLLRLQACSPSAPAQGFAYAPDYSLMLSASATVNPTTSRCLTSTPRLAGDLTNTAAGTASGGTNGLLPQGGTTAPSPGVLGPVAGSATSFPGYPGWYATSTSQTRAVAGSVAVWFRTTVASGTLVEFSSAQGTSTTKAERSLWVDASGRLVWAPDVQVKKSVATAFPVADGSWHLAVGTVGAAGAALYLDGALVAADPTVVPSQTNTGYWHVGWGSATGSAWVGAPPNASWQGALAHLATFGTQLNALQVVALQAAIGTYTGFQAAVQGLNPVNYWPLGGSYADQVVTFGVCDGLPHQQWNYNDFGRFENENPQGTGRGGLCIHASSYTAGTPLSLVACGSASQWEPDTVVGAGAAGEATAQLVNYGEYSRCLDATNWDVTWPYLIAYPCKQEAGGVVGWNQRWYVDSSTKAIYLESPTRYCLDAAVSGTNRVLLRTCNESAGQVWTVNRETGARRTAYTIVNASGKCLSLGPPGATTGSHSVWSTITADTCDGSKKQKWNAPPLTGQAAVEGYRETTRDQ